MQYRSVKGFTGWGQIGFLLLFTGLGLIVASVVQLIVGFSLVPEGTSMTNMTSEMMKSMSNPKHVNTLRVLQVMSTFLMMGIPAYLFLRLCHSKHWLWLGFSKHFTPIQVIVGFVLLFCANLVAQPLADLSKSIVSYFPELLKKAENLERIYNEQVVLMSNLTSWSEFIIAVFIIAFFPALFEEMFFRGALQNTLQRWWKRPIAAIIVTSLIFSLIHLSIYLFLSRVLLGIGLGWIFYKSRNIWVGTAVHFLNNTFALIQIFVLSKADKKVDVSKLDADLPWWAVALSFLFLIGSAYLYKIISANNAEKIRVKEVLLFEKLQPYSGIASK
jgi:membrane protease YdiL (CAAX protease family)